MKRGISSPITNKTLVQALWSSYNIIFCFYVVGEVSVWIAASEKRRILLASKTVASRTGAGPAEPEPGPVSDYQSARKNRNLPVETFEKCPLFDPDFWP